MMLSCSAAFAQTKSISLPETTSQVKNSQFISGVIFSNILKGDLKIYSTMECKQPMSLEKFNKNLIDSVVVSLTDAQTGEVTGTRLIAKTFQPDSLAHLSVHQPTKSMTTLGYMKPIYTTTGILLGQTNICYFILEDIQKIVTAFEAKNYPTGFAKQMKKYIK